METSKINQENDRKVLKIDDSRREDKK